jgi:hypothetical protein
MATNTNTSVDPRHTTDVARIAHLLAAEAALKMMANGQASSITDMRRELFLLLSVYVPSAFPATDWEAL